MARAERPHPVRPVSGDAVDNFPGGIDAGDIIKAKSIDLGNLMGATAIRSAMAGSAKDYAIGQLIYNGLNALPFPGASTGVAGAAMVGYVLNRLTNGAFGEGQSGGAGDGATWVPEVPFVGGQCTGNYQCVVRTTAPALNPANPDWDSTTAPFLAQGPIVGTTVLEFPTVWFPRIIFNGGAQEGGAGTGVQRNLYGFPSVRIVSLTRAGGLPDDCGDPPADVPPPAPNPTPIQVNINLNLNPEFNFDFPVNFNNFFLVNYMPVEFGLTIDGVKFRWREREDDPDSEGDLVSLPEDGYGQPDFDRLIDDFLTPRLDDIDEALELECEECPELPELDDLFLPFAICEEGEGGIGTATIPILAGSVTGELVQLFQNSAQLALAGCAEGGDDPPNEPRSLLFSGTATQSFRVFESPIVSPEVREVEVEVSGAPGTGEYAAGAAVLGRYGVVSIGCDRGSGVTYLPGQSLYFSAGRFIVPAEFKDADSLRVRVVVPAGASFQCYDSGKRGI